VTSWSGWGEAGSSRIWGQSKPPGALPGITTTCPEIGSSQ